MGRSSMSKAIRRRRSSPRVSPRRTCSWTRASARRSASRIDPWVAAAAAGLGRGVLLLIDYGYPAAELYDPSRRRDGTLRAYLRHRVHDDPYRHVGRQDLTAHVDISAVERAAAHAGLVHLGTTTQAEFLVGLGTGELLQRSRRIPRPRWRTTWRFVRRSCGCSTRRDGSVPGHGFRARLAGRHAAHRVRLPARDRRTPRRLRADPADRDGPHWTSPTRAITYCRAYGGAARFTMVGHDLTGSGARSCTRARRAPLPDTPCGPRNAAGLGPLPTGRGTSAAAGPAAELTEAPPTAAGPRPAARIAGGRLARPGTSALSTGSSGSGARSGRAARREFG